MRTFQKYLRCIFNADSSHSLFFCFSASNISFPSLQLTWRCDRQGYVSSLFCHLLPLALTDPNTCFQAPTAQPINHCLLIQYKRKFAQGVRLDHYQHLVSIYFGLLLFSCSMSDNESTDTPVAQTVMFFAAWMIRIFIKTDLGLCFRSFMALHSCLLSPLGNV